MTGSTQEDYANMMLAGGRSVEGNRSRSGRFDKPARSAAKPAAKKAGKAKAGKAKAAKSKAKTSKAKTRAKKQRSKRG